jgi:hypothetical protein
VGAVELGSFVGSQFAIERLQPSARDAEETGDEVLFELLVDAAQRVRCIARVDRRPVALGVDEDLVAHSNQRPRHSVQAALATAVDGVDKPMNAFCLREDFASHPHPVERIA